LAMLTRTIMERQLFCEKTECGLLDRARDLRHEFLSAERRRYARLHARVVYACRTF